jgi:hypothetical protein
VGCLANDLYSLSSLILGRAGRSQCKICEVNNVSLTTSFINLTMRTAQEQAAQFVVFKFGIYT